MGSVFRLMQSTSLKSGRSLLLAGLLVWLAPRAARAENSLSYKYESYREAGGRIAVQTRGTVIEQDLGTEMHLKLEGVLDAITGATPTGVPAPAGSDQVPTTDLHPERRKAWNADFSRQFPRINLAIGIGNSRESDYVSNGWSVNTLTDFNQKNTTLLAGLAGTDDKIKVFIQPRRARKHTNDVIVGVTQLLNPLTSVSFNVTWGRASGYLADPYRAVEKDTEVLPGIVLPLEFFENRPDYREKWIGLVGLNRSFSELHGAIDATYRYYHDTFGTAAHTVDVAWFQQIGEKVILRPGFRFYTQTAANFYHYDLNATSISPPLGLPSRLAPYYSSDYRLSAMQTFNYGLKVIWKATDRLDLDAALEQYDMRGTDGVTPQSAYPRARIITLGGKISW
jgi:hypothetical protein